MHPDGMAAHILKQWQERKPVARNVNDVFEQQMTFGQRVADSVASFGGSWTFIGMFLAAMVVWMIVNSRGPKPFDPFPFILLNLALSCVASLQAPVIMMSQNRQSAKDRIDAQHDYAVNLKAELEVLGLHEKLDEIRDARIAALQRILEEQTAMLAALAAELQKLRVQDNGSDSVRS
ncbi:MAG: DUF1003 domain-containing protein [Acidobacteriota bacterium]